MQRALLAAIALSLLAIKQTPGLGQAPSATTSDSVAQKRLPAKSTAELEAILPSQKIGPGDLLSISVADSPELTRNFRVSSDGWLTLPLLREKIRAAGKEPEELENDLIEALIRDQILVQPVVSIGVVEYRSVPVSVLGAVKKPTTFQAVGHITLLDAITRAEGLAPDAGAEILVSRPVVTATGGNSTVEHISIKKLVEEADPAANVRLYGGEEVRVPPAGRVYVLGNVKKSGSFPISDDNDTTVMKVIALSEGLLPFSNRQAFIYRREAGKKEREEIPVDITQIMHHRLPDVQLEANDILYIPDNHGKRIAAETLERLASFGSSTGSGLLIWH